MYSFGSLEMLFSVRHSVFRLPFPVLDEESRSLLPAGFSEFTEGFVDLSVNVYGNSECRIYGLKKLRIRHARVNTLYEVCTYMCVRQS